MLYLQGRTLKRSGLEHHERKAHNRESNLSMEAPTPHLCILAGYYYVLSRLLEMRNAGVGKDDVSSQADFDAERHPDSVRLAHAHGALY